MGASVINKSDFETINKLIELVENDYISLSCMEMGYFSQEILRDIEKNFVLRK